MEPPRLSDLTAVHRAVAEPKAWLAGRGAKGFAAARDEFLMKIRKTGRKVPIVVAQKKTAAYLAGVLSSVEQMLPVVLANPHWGEVEWAQAAAQIMPGIWFGEKRANWPHPKPEENFEAKDWKGAILIPTGGTGGRVRWAVHHWNTLAAAARALGDFLEAEGCIHVSTLPPWHISGLMPAVRAIETGGMLWLENWKALEGGQGPKIEPERAIISLVPTQLQRLLTKKKVMAWLKNTRAILLGGAPPSPGLLEEARRQRLPMALAYGMTETAALVALQPPKDFLAGKPPYATPLPHAKIYLGKNRRILIRAKSLFSGYYPVPRPLGVLVTEDFGKMDARGRILPLGRLDRVINTGGEKINPVDLEDQILATGLVKKVRVVGLPDAEWGERVVALYTGARPSEAKLRKALKKRVARHAIPKTWIRVKTLPAAGKKFS